MLLHVACLQASHAGSERRGKDGLDSRSFSLLQNAQALLACDGGGGSGSPHSTPTSSRRQHAAVQSPQRQGGSGDAADAGGDGGAVRLSTPGRSIRIAADSPAAEGQGQTPTRRQLTPKDTARGSSQQQRAEPGGKALAAAAAEASPTADDASPTSSNASASSRLALRIASMHEKFAAATNLLDADSSVEAAGGLIEV